MAEPEREQGQLLVVEEVELAEELKDDHIFERALLKTFHRFKMFYFILCFQVFIFLKFTKGWRLWGKCLSSICSLSILRLLIVVIVG